MAQLSKSMVSFRIAGDDLVPEEISRILGASPTEARTKGEKIVGRKTGSVRIAKTGSWTLKASDREPEDMDGQIQELLGQMTDDIATWQSLTHRYHADLFCGLFMHETDEGLIISAKYLAALGSRGIELGLCLYAPTDGVGAATA
jgi:hypothetical protein